MSIWGFLDADSTVPSAERGVPRKDFTTVTVAWSNIESISWKINAKPKDATIEKITH